MIFVFFQCFQNFSKKQEVLKLVCNFQSRMGRPPFIQGPLKQFLSLDGKIPEVKDELRYATMVHR